MKHLYRILLLAATAAFCFSDASAQNKTKATFVELPKEHGEICLGLTIQPQVLLTNVTGTTQHIKAQITVVNAVTGQSLYSSSRDILNVPANSDTLVTFPNFVTNVNDPKYLGRHVVTAIGSSMTSGGTITPDSNPQDDTLRIHVFGTRRTQMPYEDNFNSYTVTQTSALVVPTATKWVSAGATVVDGMIHTFDPPSPVEPDSGYGSLLYTAPVVKMDRRNVNGVMYTGTGVGDTLTSFPVNLSGASNVNLMFDFHRSSKRMYPYGPADSLIGPETTILNANNGIVRAGDSLVIEFKDPSASACNPASSSWMYIASIGAAKDFEWQRFFLSIDSRNKVNLNFFNSDFRFRIRLKAKSDGTTPPDDEDAWYIDNVKLSVPAAEPLTRVNWVRVVTPYTKVPSRQAIFPVYVKITNDASTLSLQYVQTVVQISGPDDQPKYQEVMFVKRPAVGRDTIVRFPDWDASNTMVSLVDREIKVQAWIHAPGFETYTANHDAYSTFYLNTEPGSSNTQEFAYDDAGITPAANGGNDFPALVGATGRGAGFNNMTGSYAMRFKLMREDTLYGARVFFGAANSAPDEIRIRIYEGSDTTDIPGALVDHPGASFDATRGTMGSQFYTYYFPTPIVLPGADANNDGVYWLSVSQLSQDNMNLGMDASRGGYQQLVSDGSNPQYLPIHRSPYATQYEPENNAGNIDNNFAVENSAGTGNWISLNPNFSVGAGDRSGALIPMIRALVGRRALLPVAFAQHLKAEWDNGAAQLTWITASEKNNHGFHIERKYVAGDWRRLGFVPSRSTNSSTPSGYTFEDVTASTGRMTYRLVQVDLDGTEALSNEAELYIGEEYTGAIRICPNPFVPSEGSVTIMVPRAEEVTITNTVGQTVRTFTSPSSSFRWDGKDAGGNMLPAGSYFITAGGQSQMIVLR